MGYGAAGELSKVLHAFQRLCPAAGEVDKGAAAGRKLDIAGKIYR
jgi:hypothetical protein